MALTRAWRRVIVDQFRSLRGARIVPPELLSIEPEEPMEPLLPLPMLPEPLEPEPMLPEPLEFEPLQPLPMLLLLLLVPWFMELPLELLP